MQASNLCRLTLLLLILISAIEMKCAEGIHVANLITTVLVMNSYSISLFDSIVLYRWLFHPVRKFSGPILAGLTKFWHVFKCLDSQNHLLLDKLYRKYGEFVRTDARESLLNSDQRHWFTKSGPNEITVFNPEVLPAIDGPGTQCIKAVWYDLLLSEVAVNTTRDKPMHDKRRRIWNHEFAVKDSSSVASYATFDLTWNSTFKVRRSSHRTRRKTRLLHRQRVLARTRHHCFIVVLLVHLWCNGRVRIRKIIWNVAERRMTYNSDHAAQCYATTWPIFPSFLTGPDRLQHIFLNMGRSRLARDVRLM